MMKTLKQNPIVIAAGGTGGHMFPAQSLAQELLARGHHVLLITDQRGMKYADAFDGADILQAPSGTPSAAGLKGKLSAVFNILKGIAFSVNVYRRVKPQLVIGFGGYPSLPPVLAGVVTATPVCLHEQNAVLGRVNRLVAPFTKKIASSFKSMKGLKASSERKVVFTGNPVRADIMAKREDIYHVPEGGGEFRILVTGGSQGATLFSDIVPVALTVLPLNIRGRISLVQQCRPEDLPRVEAHYKTAGLASVRLETFIKDMPSQMANAHLVMARSGASTVAELCAIGRPAILSPYPFAMDDHQMANARALESEGGVWVVPDRELSPVHLAQMLRAIMRNVKDLGRRSNCMRKAAPTDAAVRLADMVEDVIVKHRASLSLSVNKEELA